jgi:hypothetical protein
MPGFVRAFLKMGIGSFVHKVTHAASNAVHSVTHAADSVVRAIPGDKKQAQTIGRYALAIPTGGLSLARNRQQAIKIAGTEAAIAGVVAGGYALASYYGAPAVAGTVANPAGYAGAVFPTTAANAPALLASSASEISGTSILSAIGSGVKTAAGVITSAKIIVDSLGRRKVLPQGADVPPGYTVVGDLPKDGNLYPPTTGNDVNAAVSSDGVGFTLPSNSGFLLLALVALAFVKGH